MTWVKSSHCDTAACVEVAFRKSTRSAESFQCVEVAFVKSSRSNWAGECVEVGRCGCECAPVIYVRDSKDQAGPVLTFGRPGWAAFLAGVKAGDFDRSDSS